MPTRDELLAGLPPVQARKPQVGHSLADILSAFGRGLGGTKTAPEGFSAGGAILADQLAEQKKQIDPLEVEKLRTQRLKSAAAIAKAQGDLPQGDQELFNIINRLDISDEQRATLMNQARNDPKDARKQLVKMGFAPLPAETAGREAQLRTARNYMSALKQEMKRWAHPSTPQGIAQGTQFSTGFGKPGDAKIIGTNAMEGVLRTLTGAAAPDTEVARLSDIFIPTPWDRPERRELKIKILEKTMNNMIESMGKGRTLKFMTLDQARDRFNAAAAKAGLDTPDIESTRPEGTAPKGSSPDNPITPGDLGF